MKPEKTLYALGICLLLALPLLAATYHFHTISPFNSVETGARGINNDGDVVGDYATAADNALADQKEHGYLLHEGKYYKINFPHSYDTDANGINNEGVIVGTYAAMKKDGSRGDDFGYILDADGYHKLPRVPKAFGCPDYNAINDDGDIVGVMTPIALCLANAAVNRGFLLHGDDYTVLDCGHAQTEANGINNDGAIVGECSDAGNVEHAFVLRDHVFTVFDCNGATSGTVALAINDDGVIVGSFTDSNGDHGFVARDVDGPSPTCKIIDRPGFPAGETKITGINDGGEIVGSTGDIPGFKAERED